MLVAKIANAADEGGTHDEPKLEVASLELLDEIVMGLEAWAGDSIVGGVLACSCQQAVKAETALWRRYWKDVRLLGRAAATRQSLNSTDFWHRHMKVFISWSGEKSHKVATALRAWLPYIIQAIKPIMSSKDISKGDRWNDVLARELEDTQFGIVCLTPSNIKAPWLNFEAGALSKFVDSSSLSPLLFEVRSEEVEGPLKQFQSTIFAKEDIFSLLASINNKLEPAIRLDLTLLERTFETWWPRFKEEVQKATQTHEKSTGYEWLYHHSELSQIQRSTKCKSIWVVVPQMRHALQTSCQPAVVEKNIRSGARYRFIFPRPEPDDKIHSARESLWKVFEQCSGKREIWEINRDEFEKLVVTDFLILNPEEDYEAYWLKVLLEIPVVESKFWIEAENGAAHGFVSRFELMCRNSGALETENE